VKGQQPLVDYLKSLPEDQLRKIQTLMYFGRTPGKDTPLRHLSQTMSSSRKDVEECISGKGLVVAKYLEKALEVADERGIDIEKPFN